MKKQTLLLSLLVQFGSFHASAHEDNFDDNNSDGWTEIDSISLIPDVDETTIEFSVTDGEYRIRATAPSPNPEAFGPVRARAYLKNATSDGSFFMSVDIPAYASLNQVFGLSAMVRDIGPGSVDGYALAYNTFYKSFSISIVVDDESRFLLINEGVEEDVGTALRMTFEGENGVMTGRLYNLSDLTTPLITVTGTDTTYTSGLAGFFATNWDEESDGLVDVTIDNYLVDTDGVPDLKITLLADNDFEVSFPDWAMDHRLLSSTDLTEWHEIPSNQLKRRDGLVTFTSEAVFDAGMFYRLNRFPQLR